eukprot:7509361-Alexandrium_andersonii.AAC.1
MAGACWRSQFTSCPPLPAPVPPALGTLVEAPCTPAPRAPSPTILSPGRSLGPAALGLLAPS